MTDCEYRTKSSVSEDFTEHKQLPQDITSQMADDKAQKSAKKNEKRAKDFFRKEKYCANKRPSADPSENHQ